MGQAADVVFAVSHHGLPVFGRFEFPEALAFFCNKRTVEIAMVPRVTSEHQ